MKVRYLFIAAVFFAVLAVIGLRINQGKASELTSKVIAADQAGEDTAAALTDLRDFVSEHMNTSTRVELAASYDRAVKKAQQAATAEADEELLARAQAKCDKQGVSSVEQAQCVREFLAANLEEGSNPKPVDLPEKSQFVFAFVSPLWSPDLAGLSLLAALLFSIWALVAFVRKHYKQKQTPLYQ